MRGAVACACMLALVAGCGVSGGGETTGTASPSATSSLAAEAKTDLGRQILADGKVTAAEWAEAKQAYADCIHEKYPDAEVTWKSESSTAGGIKYYGVDTEHPDVMEQQSEEMRENEEACETDTDFWTIKLIWSSGSEPEKDTTPELVQCLVSKGLVDPSMTVEEYKQAISDPDRNHELFGGYNDPTDSRYDEQKAQQWRACQEGEDEGSGS